MTPVQYGLVALTAYLIGSFSFGIVISSTKGRDIRQEGSKSSGATNVTRVLGISYGVMTFLGDFIKAATALGAGALIAGHDGALVASVFVVIGHNWPIYYGFKGGKGIVCSVAVVLLLYPLEGILASLAAIGVIWLSRYVSLGSLTYMIVSAVILMLTRGPVPHGLWAVILLALGIFQHRSNIQRLVRGKENKFSLKRPQSPGVNTPG